MHTYLELVFDLGQFFRKDACFFSTRVNFLLQDLGSSLEDLHEPRLAHVADVVAFVVEDNALGADVYLVCLAKILSLLLWMLQTVLIGLHFLLFRILLLLFAELVEDCEVLD